MQVPTSFTATQLAAAIREGRISALETLEAYLRQIATRNPELNAIVTLDEEGARRRARETDEALAQGEIWGPLHGVPITLKDCHSTEGMRTTAGYPPLADYVPAEDGTVAARLKDAGAIIMGKTNVSELLMDIQANNPVFGRTNNPWNLERTSGGSSGGAAVALASNMTPLDIGSDFAGSLRIPAHFCGVFSLKPTEHRVSMIGHIPNLPGKPRSNRILWSIGPLARSVDDLKLAFNIIAGDDGRDPDVPSHWSPDMLPPALFDLRIAWSPTFPGVPVSEPISKAVEGLASSLAGHGARVEERLPNVSFEEQAKLRFQLAKAIAGASEPPSEGPPPILADYFAALQRRDAIIHEWERFFDEWDCLLCPVAMTTAFPHCETGTPLPVNGEMVNYWRVIGHCAPFSLTGHPVVVLPVGRDPEGLPIGVQLVGRRWDEGFLLQIAAKIAETL